MLSRFETWDTPVIGPADAVSKLPCAQRIRLPCQLQSVAICEGLVDASGSDWQVESREIRVKARMLNMDGTTGDFSLWDVVESTQDMDRLLGWINHVITYRNVCIAESDNFSMGGEGLLLRFAHIKALSRTTPWPDTRDGLSLELAGRGPMSDTCRCIVIAVETTGMNPCDHDIIRIDTVEIPAGQPVGPQRRWHFRPRHPLSEATASFLGVDRGCLDEQPSFEEVVEELLTSLADARLIVHDAHVDIRFLNHALERAGSVRLIEAGYVVDTRELAR